MLPRKNRLSGRKNFDLLKEKGTLFQSPFFGLLVLPNNTNFPSRIGLVVSLKISKKATERNRIKRVLREVIRDFLPDLKPGFDLAFLVRQNLYNEKKDTIAQEVLRVFEKANLLK